MSPVRELAARVVDATVLFLLGPPYIGPSPTSVQQAREAIGEAHELAGGLNGQALGLLPILVGLSAVIGVSVLTESAAEFWLAVAPGIAFLTFAIWSCVRALMQLPGASRHAWTPYLQLVLAHESAQLARKIRYVRFATTTCLPTGFFVALAALLHLSE